MIRDKFPMLKNNPSLIYFDNAATTFKPQEVIAKINEFYTNSTTNINRGDYDLSYKISNEFENVREIVRTFINATSVNEIVFTSGASASLNTVAYGYGLTNLKKGDIILTSESEHSSSILPWFRVADSTGAIIKYIPLEKDGSFSIENFKKSMSDKVKVVALAHISNVLGYIIDIKQISSIAHSYGAIVSIDAAQSIGHIKIDVKDMDVDFLSFSAHKLYGPSGVGVLYGKYHLLESSNPYFYGGGSNITYDNCGNLKLKNSPYKFESGTSNIEGVLGLGRAIEFLNENDFEKLILKEKELTRYFIQEISKLDNVILYNPKTDSSIITFNIKGIFAQDVCVYLNRHNICVRSGLHCAKILAKVLETEGTIRASISFYNEKSEIDRFIEVLKNVTLDKCLEDIL